VGPARPYRNLGAGPTRERDEFIRRRLEDRHAGDVCDLGWPPQRFRHEGGHRAFDARPAQRPHGRLDLASTACCFHQMLHGVDIQPPSSSSALLWRAVKSFDHENQGAFIRWIRGTISSNTREVPDVRWLNRMIVVKDQTSFRGAREPPLSRVWILSSWTGVACHSRASDRPGSTCRFRGLAGPQASRPCG
jgi:hypothetical protein